MRALISGVMVLGLVVGSAGNAWAIHDEPQLFSSADGTVKAVSATTDTPYWRTSNQISAYARYTKKFKNPLKLTDPSAPVTTQSGTSWFSKVFGSDINSQYVVDSSLSGILGSSGALYQTLRMMVFDPVRSGTVIVNRSRSLTVPNTSSPYTVYAMVIGTGAAPVTYWHTGSNDTGHRVFWSRAKAPLTGGTGTRSASGSYTWYYFDLGYAHAQRKVGENKAGTSCGLFGCSNDWKKYIIDQVVYSNSSLSPFPESTVSTF